MSKITEYERNHAKKYEKQCNDRRRNEENMVAEREEVQLTEEREDVQYNKQRKRNEMEIVFDAVSCNESFARVAVAAFITHLNPTLEELADIKTAVSEAVTNAIIHGYENLAGYSRHGESISGVQHRPSGKSADALCPGWRCVIHRDHRSGKGNRGY